MELTIEKLKEDEVEDFAILASNIWHEYFTFLLSTKQIDYMVDMFFNPLHIREQIRNEKYEYYWCKLGDNNIGFIGIQLQDESVFLSKLYLVKEVRGKGIASKMLAFVIERAKLSGKNKLWLTCNKNNIHSLEVYRAKGWRVIDEQVFDIGNGYVMDDFVLEYKIDNKN